MESIHMQQNMSCVALLIPTHKTPTDREMAEIEAGGEKAIDKRQEERDAKLATLEVRYDEGGYAQKLASGAPRGTCGDRDGDEVFCL